MSSAQRLVPLYPYDCTDEAVFVREEGRGVSVQAGGSHLHPVDPTRVAAARARMLSEEEAGSLAGLLGLLADPTRSRILYALDLVEELCVGDLALALGANENTVGYALRLLRTAGLVATRKAGRVVYYRLAPGFPQPLRAHCLPALIELARTAPDEDD